MADFVFINVLNEGMIPFINEKGPVFGKYLGLGVVDMMKRDPRLIIQFTNPVDAVRQKQEYEFKKIKEREAAKEKEAARNVVEVKQSVVEIPFKEKVVKTAEDDEIDRILKENKFTPGKVKIPNDEKKMHMYRITSLKDMTKAELKAILHERGYYKGEYAPKYHDTIEMLIEKVKKTQKL